MKSLPACMARTSPPQQDSDAGQEDGNFLQFFDNFPIQGRIMMT